METCSDVAPSDPLQLFPCLDQQMSLWHLHYEFLTSIQPRKQPRKPCFSVNGEQIEISMKSSQNIALLMPGKVNSRWRQHKITLYKSTSYILRLKAKTNCQHLCYRKTPILHVQTPLIHSCLPLWKIGRKDINLIANFPMKPPLRISGRRKRSQRLIWLLQFPLLLLVSLKPLLKLMHKTHLKFMLRREINRFVALVKLLASLSEIPFHKVQENIILGSINSWIVDDHQTIFSENLRDFLAVILVIALLAKKVRNVYQGDFDILYPLRQPYSVCKKHKAFINQSYISSIKMPQIYQNLLLNILWDKLIVPNFYYNTPKQQKLQNYAKQHKQQQLQQTVYEDKEAQTQTTQKTQTDLSENGGQNAMTFLNSQVMEISRKEQFNKIFDHSVSGIFSHPNTLRNYQPFGYFSLPTISMYVRESCFEVVCAKFNKIKNIYSSVLIAPFDYKLPNYVRLLFDPEKAKEAEDSVKNILQKKCEGDLAFLRCETSNFNVLALFKLTKFLSKSLLKGVCKMLNHGKELQNGRHKNLTIIYQGRFDCQKKLVNNIMGYLQTIKPRFFDKITIICGQYEDFEKISDLFRQLISKFLSSNEIAL